MRYADNNMNSSQPLYVLHTAKAFPTTVQQHPGHQVHCSKQQATVTNGHYHLVTFPFLTIDGHQTVEQLVSHGKSRQSPRLPHPIDNLQPIGNLAICSPPNNKFGLPAQPSNLLQLLDIGNRHRKYRLDATSLSGSFSGLGCE